MIASKHTGFTLIEVMIAMAIIAILTAIAFPSYQNYITRSSRSAAQTELLELANLQEKIFLNTTCSIDSDAAQCAALIAPNAGYGLWTYSRRL